MTILLNISPFPFVSSVNQDRSGSNNDNLYSIGRLKQVEYFMDSESGERRQARTHLWQTGRRKAYKRHNKVQQRIDWRKDKLSEYLVRCIKISNS